MGVTPLMAAAGIGTRTGQSVLGPGPPADVEARSIETMDILIKAGANVNARITDTTSLTARIARASTMTNREGQTALFFAAQSGTRRRGPVPARSRRRCECDGRLGKSAAGCRAEQCGD